MASVTRRNFIKNSTALSAGLVAGALFGNSAMAAEGESGDSGTSSTGGLETRYSTDILIVGSGQAGLSAGLRALELGAENVLIVEKLSGEGYNYAGSSMVCSGNYLHPADDSEEAAEVFANAVWNYGLQKGDFDLISTFAGRSYETLNWMKEQGVEYGDPSEVTDGVYSSNMTPTVTMPLLLENYKNNGGQILFSTKAEKLNVGPSGICGILARDDSGYFNIEAKQTILCTGGYASNKHFLSDHVGDSAEGIVSRARTSTTGDGIPMVQAVGGYTVGVNGKNSLYLGPAAAQSPSQGQVGSWSQHIAINAEGKRFVDESSAGGDVANVVLDQTNQQCAYIFDAEIAELMQSKIDRLTGNGIDFITADTLEELAEQIDVPAETLLATVEEFNNAIEDGVVTSLEVNKSADAIPVATAPFYALYPVIIGMSLTYGGIGINTKAQVVQADGSVIPNLYASGELAGGFFYKNYYGGSQMAKAAVFGHIAAENAVAALQ